jgi:hydrogenase maturation protease HycI
LLTDEIKKVLTPVDDEKLLVICIGNIFRKDDGAAPYIAERINVFSKNFLLINAGDRPENSIDQALDFSGNRIVIVDAADFDGIAGEVRIIPIDLIPENTLSTHTFPVKIIAKLLEHESNAEVYFIGIQGKDFDFGEGLSGKVKESADEIISIFKKS